MHTKIQVVTKDKDFLAHMMQPNPEVYYYFRPKEYDEIKTINIPEIREVVIYADIIDEHGAIYTHPSFAPELLNMPIEFKSPIIVNTSNPLNPFPENQTLDLNNLTRYVMLHKVGFHIPDVIYKWK